MQPIGFNEAIEAIVKDDLRYDREAYAFLRDTLEVTAKRRRKSRKEARDTPPQHISASELLEGFRLHALKEFGPMALMVLDHWGVRCCEDVGNMVFNLVRAQVFGKTDDDTIEAFRAGFDFDEAFSAPFRPTQKSLSASRPGAVELNS
jgi:uncharacterized repeat protein (TIGR04138 family)